MTSGRQSTLSLYGVVSFKAFKDQLVAQEIPFCISALLIEYLVG